MHGEVALGLCRARQSGDKEDEREVTKHHYDIDAEYFIEIVFKGDEKPLDTVADIDVLFAETLSVTGYVEGAKPLLGFILHR